MKQENSNSYLRGYAGQVGDFGKTKHWRAVADNGPGGLFRGLFSGERPKQIEEYDEQVDKNIMESTPYNQTTESDWERDGEKTEHDYSQDRIKKGKMHTHTDDIFRYSKSLEDYTENNFADLVKNAQDGDYDEETLAILKSYKSSNFDDPTYLGFNVMFDTASSPLWNYGDYEAFSLTTQGKNSVGSFLGKYSNIPDIANRMPIYLELLKTLDRYFNRTLDEGFPQNRWKKAYYIETITGLDKLSSKMVKYGEDKINIALSEDVSLKTTYLAELYNNLIYSYKEQRYVMPENTLRFDLIIEVTDIRIFKLLLNNSDGGLTSTINNDPPRIVYTLQDCNFDFSKSIPFDAAISMAGYGSKASTTPAGLNFDIKYKSIKKEFKSSLIGATALTINNKADQLINNTILSQISLLENNIISDKQTQVKVQQENFSYSNRLSPLKDLNGEKPSLVDKLKGNLKDGLDNYKDKLIRKFDSIRGRLINDALSQIRGSLPVSLPKIYPDNVYATDFRTLSLESFARGLGSSVANTLEDAARGGALNATNLFHKK